MEYYGQRIRYHAKSVMSIEKRKTGLRFFTDDECGGVASGRLDVYRFAERVEALSYSTEFYAKLKANLTPSKLRRVVDELGFIRRPMQGAIELLHAAQQCSGFRNIKIVLLNSLPARNIKEWQLPKIEISLSAGVKAKFHSEAKKKKNVHAEMLLATHLLGINNPRLEVFPYLGVSKKTCLLCGHMLEAVGQFATRGNHGKCYSQWTLPLVLWTSPEATEILDKAVLRLRDILREMATEEVPHRDAERESVMAAPIPPRYRKEMTIFNAVIEDSRLIAREEEWISAFRGSVLQPCTLGAQHTNNILDRSLSRKSLLTLPTRGRTVQARQAEKLSVLRRLIQQPARLVRSPTNSHTLVQSVRSLPTAISTATVRIGIDTNSRASWEDRSTLQITWCSPATQISTRKRRM